MKVISLIARILLGLLFLVFGLNGFLNFLHMPMPTGVAGQFIGAMYQSHMLQVIWILQIIGAILLLSGYYIPLALTILGPIIVNIFLFHALMAPSAILNAIIALVLWLLVFYPVRSAFAGIFVAKTGEPLPT
jgi:putative oxidoreductase